MANIIDAQLNGGRYASALAVNLDYAREDFSEMDDVPGMVLRELHLRFPSRPTGILMPQMTVFYKMDDVKRLCNGIDSIWQYCETLGMPAERVFRRYSYIDPLIYTFYPLNEVGAFINNLQPLIVVACLKNPIGLL